MRKLMLSREKFQFRKTLTWQIPNTCRLFWRDWQWHIKMLVFILCNEMCQHFKICLTQWTYISKWTITSMTNSCLDMSSPTVQREQRLISNSMETTFLWFWRCTMSIISSLVVVLFVYLAFEITSHSTTAQAHLGFTR